MGSQVSLGKSQSRSISDGYKSLCLFYLLDNAMQTDTLIVFPRVYDTFLSQLISQNHLWQGGKGVMRDARDFEQTSAHDM